VPSLVLINFCWSCKNHLLKDTFSWPCMCISMTSFNPGSNLHKHFS
jgi:hypothetical protein